MTFNEFKILVETKTEPNRTYTLRSVTDFAKSLQAIFRKYSFNTRKTMWKKIKSKHGESEVAKLMKNPNRNLSGFRTL